MTDDGEPTRKILQGMGYELTVDEAISLEHQLFGALSASHRAVVKALEPLWSVYAPQQTKRVEEVVAEIVADLVKTGGLLREMSETCRTARDVVETVSTLLKKARAAIPADNPSGIRWWVVVGRLHGDDEATTSTFSAPDRCSALDAFAEELLGIGYADDWQEWSDDDPRGHVYIDTVLSYTGTQPEES